MSYDFVLASSQRIESNATFAAQAMPITMAIWVNVDLSATGTRFMSLRREGASSGCLELGTNTADQFIANHNQETTNGSATSTATYTTGTWYHVAGVFNSITSRTLYVDGVEITTNTTSVATANYLLPTIGARRRQNTYSTFYDGKAAEACVWNVALTAAEIMSLYRGFRASLIRPDSLLYYAALAGRADDVCDNVAPTLTNTPTKSALHPRRIA